MAIKYLYLKLFMINLKHIFLCKIIVMYLSNIKVKNFRLFKDFSLKLNRGLNLIVGENDSGKTALIDAIRLVLDTNSAEWVRFKDTDFHEGNTSLCIQLEFRGLNISDQAVFPDHLTFENKDGEIEAILFVTLSAKNINYAGRIGQFIKVEIKSGENSEGPLLEREARMYLSTTYLKPLRDVEGELSAGRASRLSQLLASHKSLGKDETDIVRLINIVIKANQTIKSDISVRGAKDNINELLKELTFKDKQFSPMLNMLGSKALEDLSAPEKFSLFRAILEKLSLNLNETGRSHGLGYSNLLFMAAELMLLTQESEGCPLLLIEEPEAHLHPQLQMKFLNYLTKHQPDLQCILTTHSPHFASKAPLTSIIIMNSGIAFPLRKENTKLSDDDYPFLEKFLDVTKANMFFAKGVLMVEGDGENILLPTIAELVERPLEDYGVSIVNIGNLAYKRYAKIYRSKDTEVHLPIKVACITDIDLWPDKAELKEGNTVGFKEKKLPNSTLGRKGNMKYWKSTYDTPEKLLSHIQKKQEHDGDNVKTFISNEWTFEYCLARYGLAELVYESIKKEGSVTYSTLSEDDEEKAIQIYEMIEKASSGKTEATYKLVDFIKDKYMGKPEEFKRVLPKYILEAIEYVTEPFIE